MSSIVYDDAVRERLPVLIFGGALGFHIHKREYGEAKALLEVEVNNASFAEALEGVLADLEQHVTNSMKVLKHNVNKADFSNGESLKLIMIDVCALDVASETVFIFMDTKLANSLKDSLCTAVRALQVQYNVNRSNCRHRSTGARKS